MGSVIGSSFADPACCELLVNGVGWVFSILGGPKTSSSASAGLQKTGTSRLTASPNAACLLAFENNLMASDFYIYVGLSGLYRLAALRATACARRKIDMLDGY
ncbi:MAG: hypothetical protein DKT66_07655 [Candidatus Melainabacteria bacterium]|nr:MAG: hypothetical protein DKT66_07655 [Candidatus Melainabacteria bacterium]